MLTARRVTAYLAAIALGLVTGWSAARTGGSLDRAPAALAVMTVGLGATAIGLGILLGRANDKTGAVVGVLLVLASYYLGTLASPFHSLAGDVMVVACASVPAGLSAVAGFCAGRALATSG